MTEASSAAPENARRFMRAVCATSRAFPPFRETFSKRRGYRILTTGESAHPGASVSGSRHRRAVLDGRMRMFAALVPPARRGRGSRRLPGRTTRGRAVPVDPGGAPPRDPRLPGRGARPAAGRPRRAARPSRPPVVPRSRPWSPVGARSRPGAGTRPLRRAGPGRPAARRARAGWRRAAAPPRRGRASPWTASASARTSRSPAAGDRPRSRRGCGCSTATADLRGGPTRSRWSPRTSGRARAGVRAMRRSAPSGCGRD